MSQWALEINKDSAVLICHRYSLLAVSVKACFAATLLLMRGKQFAAFYLLLLLLFWKNIGLTFEVLLIPTKFKRQNLSWQDYEGQRVEHGVE